MKHIIQCNITSIIVATIISGCSDGSKSTTATNLAQNEEEKEIVNLRESETLTAFGNIQFGDSRKTVEEKLEITPNIKVTINGGVRRILFGAQNVSVELEYNDDALYDVTFLGYKENLAVIEKVLAEKYKLSWGMGMHTEDEHYTPQNTKYKSAMDLYTVGSRKSISFNYCSWYHESDKRNKGYPPMVSSISIYDHKVLREIISKKEQKNQEKLNNDLINTRKTF